MPGVARGSVEVVFAGHPTSLACNNIIPVLAVIVRKILQASVTSANGIFTLYSYLSKAMPKYHHSGLAVVQSGILNCAVARRGDNVAVKQKGQIDLK